MTTTTKLSEAQKTALEYGVEQVVKSVREGRGIPEALRKGYEHTQRYARSQTVEALGRGGYLGEGAITVKGLKECGITLERLAAEERLGAAEREREEREREEAKKKRQEKWRRLSRAYEGIEVTFHRYVVGPETAPLAGTIYETFAEGGISGAMLPTEAVEKVAEKILALEARVKELEEERARV